MRPCRAWLTTRSTTFVLYVYEYECDTCSALRQPWYLNEGLVARGSSAGTNQRGSKLADVDMHAQLVVSSSTPTLTTTEPSLEALAKKKSHYINIYAFSALLSLPCCDKTPLPARLWAELSESLSNTKHAEIMFHPNSSRSVFPYPLINNRN